jgi:hypothetical protein
MGSVLPVERAVFLERAWMGERPFFMGKRGAEIVISQLLRGSLQPELAGC